MRYLIDIDDPESSSLLFHTHTEKEEIHYKVIIGDPSPDRKKTPYGILLSNAFLSFKNINNVNYAFFNKQVKNDFDDDTQIYGVKIIPLQKIDKIEGYIKHQELMVNKILLVVSQGTILKLNDGTTISFGLYEGQYKWITLSGEKTLAA